MQGHVPTRNTIWTGSRVCTTRTSTSSASRTRWALCCAMFQRTTVATLQEVNRCLFVGLVARDNLIFLTRCCCIECIYRYVGMPGKYNRTTVLSTVSFTGCFWFLVGTFVYSYHTDGIVRSRLYRQHNIRWYHIAQCKRCRAVSHALLSHSGGAAEARKGGKDAKGLESCRS